VSQMLEGILCSCITLFTCKVMLVKAVKETDNCSAERELCITRSSEKLQCSTYTGRHFMGSNTTCICIRLFTCKVMAVKHVKETDSCSAV
jgi:hypothetical protein